MSVAMLSSISASFYQMAGAMPVTAMSATPATAASPATPPKRVDHDDDDRPRLRENTLVSAMMAAFKALGIGQAAVIPTTTPASTAVTSTTTKASSAVVTTSSTTTPTPPAATTVTTPTDAAPAADTLEKAVNEFAHALFSMLHRQGRSGHADGEHDGEHGHSHEDRRSGGYSSFVQRLEQLAQSLGAAPAVAAGASTVASATTTTPSVTQTTVTPGTPATTSTVPSTDTATPAPSRGVTRLLAAFSKVLSLLQPPVTSTGSTTPADTTTASTAGISTSTADKLKLFLTTLAQSLHSGAATTAPSAVGSRLDVTA